MVLYVEYDATMQSYVAVCDDDRVVLLGAETQEAAEAEADVLDDSEILYDEM